MNCSDKGGTDKLLHIITSYALALTSGVIFSLFIVDGWAQAAAFALTMLLGIAKEMKDAATAGNHGCEWDLLADLAGAIGGTAAACMLIAL